MDVSSPNERRPSLQLACKQCRARKVKCDRRTSGCMRCERLELTCSYVTNDTAEESLNSPGEDLTQAGIKRRRILRACTPCRIAKSKCSGTSPCKRCQSLGQECVFSNDPASSSIDIGVEAHQSPTSTPQTHYGSMPSQASMDISPAAVDETNCAFEIESKSTIRTYLDTYFNKSDIADCVFLHRATTISEWTQGKLEKTLLKAICASALRLTPGYDAEISPAHKWISQVQNELTNQMGDLSIPKLQSLVLVVEFLFSMQFTGDVWVLVSIASRIAFTKRLNYERPAIDAIKQECLRRLMWSIYRIDKVFSGGIEDLTVCPTQRMHIRLPSSQHNFQLGSRSKAPFLWSKSEDGTDLNVLAFLMRMYDIRDRVLRLMIMCHSDEARAYTMLHTLLLSSRCDLHRFLIPGIREAVSPEAMNQTPREYTDYCQQRCLQTSLKYIEMWFIIRQMETNSRVGTPTSAVVTYQMVKIIDHLAGLLPLNGDTSLLAIKQRLVDILPVVSGGRSGVGWTRSCLIDIENLIPQLGTRHASLGSP
ncbi:uncharacterized protein B0J16DRAFT_405516 [Fusarium flagelliforme]|uniref:uncharacterized protein n=1 Tax=Fusarium flagelliforme TaxID=2675880 RepID=UPI001E8E2C7E